MIPTTLVVAFIVGVEFVQVDLTIILSALFVAVPATIAAWASIDSRRDMKTNDGKRPGEYIELSHTRLENLEEALNDHMVNDTENFAKIRAMLEAQNILSAKRAAPFPTDYPASNQPQEIVP